MSLIQGKRGTRVQGPLSVGWGGGWGHRRLQSYRRMGDKGQSPG